jgi:hypothetical protein
VVVARRRRVGTTVTTMRLRKWVLFRKPRCVNLLLGRSECLRYAPHRGLGSSAQINMRRLLGCVETLDHESPASIGRQATNGCSPKLAARGRHRSAPGPELRLQAQVSRSLSRGHSGRGSHHWPLRSSDGRPSTIVNPQHARNDKAASDDANRRPQGSWRLALLRFPLTRIGIGLVGVAA